jgi:hypothetical protein
MKGLDDAALLWSTLDHVPRGLILHGHLHRRIQRILRTSRGHLDAIGATSASLEHEDESKMAGFNVYEIGDEGAVGRVEAHVFDLATERFELSSVPRVVETPPARSSHS